jgi:hypothetical protein
VKRGVVPSTEEKNKDFAPNPNLSFNVGISKLSPELVVAITMLGLSLYLSFISYTS